MKKLILLAFVIITNVFAGDTQETFCGDKSLSYCINHFDRQCKAKNYFACYVVGGLYREQRQYSEAKKYFEMVCDKANSKDSYEIELINGRMGPKVPIIKMMQVSCSFLWNFYYSSWGGRQDYEKAFQYKKKACDLGDSNGCSGVWFIYDEDEVVMRQSHKKALQAASNSILGISYYEGLIGGRQDYEKAFQYSKKACDLGEDYGCYLLGKMYSNGEGAKQNLSKAKELFGKACDLGEQNGCDSYKELKEKGY